ncbi:DUF5679 domain-containing protein [Dictyobacter aurantiacus]|uniref:DUF5679 domain-containing protein n=1 Tax=Dictyobacter aurantiacus TaxID=1936993 RepID=UPI000F82CEBD|nr:DUF5679 domain-containing protein [Dictyobacter aurantiacus]
MRRVGRYGRIVVRILIVVTVGILFMLGRYVLQRLSSRLQTSSLGRIASPLAEEGSSIPLKHDANRTEVVEALSSSTEPIALEVDESVTAKCISASEEPINETVSPVIADPSVSEEVVEPTDLPPAQQVSVPDVEPSPDKNQEADLQQESAVEPDMTEKEPMEAAVAQTEAYCMKCRARRGMKDARRIVTKNNRSAMEGICPVCGTRLFRFISTSN